MMNGPRHAACFVFGALLACPTTYAEPATVPTWRGVNPDMLSGGLFAALDAEGAFGTAAPVPRARAGYVDLSKGRPPAVLDPRVGLNLPIGEDPTALPATQRGQAEPHVVRTLTDPALLLATFQDGRFSDAGAIGCGYAVSRDGGFTWSRALIPSLTTASGGRFNRATDPVAGTGPQGDLYLQTLCSVRGAFELAAVVLSRSTDGGRTWSAPFTVFESNSTLLFPDKNWLAVNDYAGTPTFGRLVSTWTNFHRNAAGATIGNPVVAAVSDDRGATWSPAAEITPLGSSNQGTQPVFLPDGSLLVVYIAFINPSNVAQFSLLAKRSLDGGRTFPAAATTIVPVVAGWDDPELRDGVFLPSVAVARQTGEVHVTYVAVVAGTPRVLVTRSANLGATWSPPQIASDQPAGVSVMNPAVAVTPDGRSLSVVYMDKRHAPDRRGFVDHYAALSLDGGATWQPNLRLTDMSSDIRYGPVTSRGVMLGDYLGLAPAFVDGQPFVAVWCDTRTGDSDPFAARFMPAANAEYGGWAAVRGVRGPFLADDDGDGKSNYLEYVDGSDPLRAESGLDLVFTAPAPGSLDVAWVERASVAKPPYSDGVSVATLPAFAAGAFSGANTLQATLPVDQLPDVAVPEGLAWRGVRLSVPPGEPRVAVRSMRFSAGLPVQASTSIASIRTDSRLINLSTRGRVSAGSGPLIVGFVIDGPKSILVRAAGPTLSTLGVSAALSDPRLALSSVAPGFSRSNDDWQQDGAVTAAVFSRLGAFPFAPGSRDAALASTLTTGGYTAVASTADANGGIALVEAYDADPTPGAPVGARLLNLSARAESGSGETVLIAGFIIAGTQPRQVLLRAVGPTLDRFGVAGAMADPALTLYAGETPLAHNDDWEISRSGAAVAATARRVGAFSLPAGSLDAVLLLTLPPGAYTVSVTDVRRGTGVVLLEVYDAD